MGITTKLVAAEQIETREQSLPAEIAPGWVRLRLECAGICGTDMHYFRHFGNAGFPLQNPVSLGHEACARVVDANGSGLEEGTLVALNPIIACGECEYCQKGQENLCLNKRFPGSALTVPHLDGFFQDTFDFPAKCCVPAPSGVDARHLAFAEPLACSLHAVNLAKVEAGSRVLVMGCGPMGLLAIIGAVAKGATVECADLKADLVHKGEALGASRGYVLGEGGDSLPEASYDCVVEATGAIPAFNLALSSARKGGAVTILSTLQPGASGVDLHLIMIKELSVVGAFQFNSEFADAVDTISSAKFDFDQIIAKRFPLEQASEAFALAVSGEAGGKVQFAGS